MKLSLARKSSFGTIECDLWTDENADRVMEWIAQNFVVKTIKIEPFPLIPGGHRIIDQKGDEVLVYCDVLTDEIKWMEPDSC